MSRVDEKKKKITAMYIKRADKMAYLRTFVSGEKLSRFNRQLNASIDLAKKVAKQLRRLLISYEIRVSVA